MRASQGGYCPSGDISGSPSVTSLEHATTPCASQFCAGDDTGLVPCVNAGRSWRTGPNFRGSPRVGSSTAEWPVPGGVLGLSDISPLPCHNLPHFVGYFCHQYQPYHCIMLLEKLHRPFANPKFPPSFHSFTASSPAAPKPSSTPSSSRGFSCPA